MYRKEHLSPSQAAGWSIAGFAAGLMAGLLLGEWFGPTPPRRGRRGPSRIPSGRRAARPTAGKVTAEAQAALAGDPAFATLSARAVGPHTVEVTGWVADRAARTRAARLVHSLPAVDTLINSVLVRGEDDQRRIPDLRLTDQSA